MFTDIPEKNVGDPVSHSEINDIVNEIKKKGAKPVNGTPKHLLVVDPTGDDIEEVEASEVCYIPTVVIAAKTVADKGVSSTTDVIFTGTFMDAITEAILVGGTNLVGTSASITSKSYNSLTVSVTTNGTEQSLTLRLTDLKKVQHDYAFNVVTIAGGPTIPSTSGTGSALWVSPANANNGAILTTGGFESPEAAGTGYDDHAYYGTFTATEIVHRFTVDRAVPVVSANALLASMRFDTDNSAGNTGIRMYFYIDGSNNPICRFHHLTGAISLGAVAQGDAFEIKLTATSLEIKKNNIVLNTNNTEDFSSCMTNAYVTLSAYRTLKLSGIQTEIIS